MGIFCTKRTHTCMHERTHTHTLCHYCPVLCCIHRWQWLESADVSEGVRERLSAQNQLLQSPSKPEGEYTHLNTNTHTHTLTPSHMLTHTHTYNSRYQYKLYI